MSEKELILIINEAIPLRSCAQDRDNDLKRRLYLFNKIKALMERELSKQFNAKQLS